MINPASSAAAIIASPILHQDKSHLTQVNSLEYRSLTLLHGSIFSSFAATFAPQPLVTRFKYTNGVFPTLHHPSIAGHHSKSSSMLTNQVSHISCNSLPASNLPGCSAAIDPLHLSSSPNPLAHLLQRQLLGPDSFSGASDLGRRKRTAAA